MAREHEQAFREVVNKVIDRQIGLCEQTGRSWLDYKIYSVAAGVRFARLERKDGHYEPFPIGHEGRLWGASPEVTMRTGDFVGRLAVVSFEDKPGLFRYWSINTQSQGFSPTTSRPLDDGEAACAVDWLNSPHLYPENLAAISALTEEETEDMTTRSREDAVEADELRQALGRLAQARRQLIPNLSVN